MTFSATGYPEQAARGPDSFPGGVPCVQALSSLEVLHKDEGARVQLVHGCSIPLAKWNHEVAVEIHLVAIHLIEVLGSQQLDLSVALRVPSARINETSVLPSLS